MRGIAKDVDRISAVALTKFQVYLLYVKFSNNKGNFKRSNAILEQKYHVRSLGLFGSIVRDDFSPLKSDVDIVVKFNKPVGIGFIELADLLEQRLQHKIDLVSRKGIKYNYFLDIEREIVYV